jgi:hypothetical protein
MKSKFLSLSTQDFLKGLFVAFITALLTGIYQVFQTASTFDWPTLKPVLFTAIAAGLSYVIKNYLTNSEGQLLKTEKYALKHPVKSNGSLKTILLIFMLSCFGIAANAQGFFKPVTPAIFKSTEKSLFASENQSAWLLRPSVQITAVQLTWNKETKSFDSSPLSSAGAGVSYQHYINVNGNPFNNWGVNLLALLGTDLSKITPASLGFAATVNVSIVNAGIGYNLGNKLPFILTGVVLKF